MLKRGKALFINNTSLKYSNVNPKCIIWAATCHSTRALRLSLSLHQVTWRYKSDYENIYISIRMYVNKQMFGYFMCLCKDSITSSISNAVTPSIIITTCLNKQIKDYANGIMHMSEWSICPRILCKLKLTWCNDIRYKYQQNILSMLDNILFGC